MTLTTATMRHILISLIMTPLGCWLFNNGIAAQTTTRNMDITIDGQTRSATLVDNQAANDLLTRLQGGAITLTLNSGGDFEIWGPLGFSLTRSDQQTTAQPGDIILYNGSNICFFYGTNTWSYTRLGSLENMTESELRTFLKAGENNIRVMLSITSGVDAIQSPQPTDNASDDDAYYSLLGQRVANPSKGIYIKNGKKIIL